MKKRIAGAPILHRAKSVANNNPESSAPLAAHHEARRSAGLLSREQGIRSEGPYLAGAGEPALERSVVLAILEASDSRCTSRLSLLSFDLTLKSVYCFLLTYQLHLLR